MSDWIYNGKVIESLDDMPDNVFGFIYRVTHKPTGRKYLGRKQLIYERKRKIGKRETKRLKEEKKEAGEDHWWIVPKYKYIKKESDWKDYYGSSDEVQELLEQDGEDSFERNILCYGFSKKQLNYLETKYLFTEEVLEKDEYINSNIQGKYYPKDTKVELND